jgi:hypothetical protein
MLKPHRLIDMFESCVTSDTFLMEKTPPCATESHPEERLARDSMRTAFLFLSSGAHRFKEIDSTRY